MLSDNRPVTSGWLHKSARFSWINSLKSRYFVLLDTELRYYKHPDDAHPAGIIELKHVHDLEEHSSSVLFGFKLVSQTKGHWIPILYAETSKERHLWMTQIMSNLNRLSSCSHYHCLPDFCSQDFYHRHHAAENKDTVGDIYHSVLDRWLDKLDLYHGSDSNSDYFPNQSNSDTTTNSSNHSLGGYSSSSASNYKSNESINTAAYNKNICTEPSALTSSSSHLNQQYSKSIKNTGRQHSAPPLTAKSQDSFRPNLCKKRFLDSIDSVTYSANNNQSIESERSKYTESTLKYFKHPHIHRSKSTKFHSELGISLSPPPPRR